MYMKKIIIAIIIIAAIIGAYSIIQNKNLNQESEPPVNDRVAIIESENSNELPIDGQESNFEIQQDNVLFDGEYEIDSTASIVAWNGRTPVKHHTGTVVIESGMFSVVDGDINSGEVVIDMDSIISDTDAVTSHLKSEDFFDVSSYPISQISITGTTELGVTADLTIHGVTQSIIMPAIITQTPDGVVRIQSDFTFNRVDYGVDFKSGTLLGDIGDAAINDDVEISIDIIAEQK